MADFEIILLAGILFIVVFLAVFVAPRIAGQGKEGYKKIFSEIESEYVLATRENDPTTRQLKLQKVVSRLDNFIGKILAYYGCNDKSVNNQIRMAMQKKIYTYDEFKIVQNFHRMRNQVIHEDRMIHHSDIEVISYVFSIIRKLV